jgi:kinetochore protein Mis12/MTW1
MAPRKSTYKATGTSSATLMHPQTTPASSARAQRSVASSSKVTLDAIPPVNLPETITPGYVLKQGPARGLDEEERGRMIHEVGGEWTALTQLVGFYPRALCESITRDARDAAMQVSARLEPPITQQAQGRGQEYEREVDIVSTSRRRSRRDCMRLKRSFRTTRNTFDVPDDLEVVMVSLVEIRLISPGARIWILSAGRTSRRCRGARTPWSSR